MQRKGVIRDEEKKEKRIKGGKKKLDRKEANMSELTHQSTQDMRYNLVVRRRRLIVAVC